MQQENKSLKKLIEAALFLSSEPFQITELSRLTGATIEQTRKALNELGFDFEERNSALEIQDDSTGIKLTLKPEFDEFAKNFSTVPEINKSVLKTLAFISFKQPVKQTEIIKFRNNKAYEHIKTLEEKGFIRRETVGKTFIVFTTKKFVEYFGEPKNPLVFEKKI